MCDVLTVEGLTKTYPAFQLRQVSFSLSEGSIMGFIGRNGAGKPTTLKSLLNLVHPDSGEIRFFGMDWSRERNQTVHRLCLRRRVLLPQKADFSADSHHRPILSQLGCDCL